MIIVDTLSGRYNAHTGSGFFSGMLDGLKGLADGWRGYTTFSELSDLDDATLAAHGLTRADLPCLALAAIQRRD